MNILILILFALMPQKRSVEFHNDMDCRARVQISNGYEFVINPGQALRYDFYSNADTITLDITRLFHEQDCGCNSVINPEWVRLKRVRASIYFYQVKLPVKEICVFHIVKPDCRA